MNILAIDTAVEVCSAALRCGDEVLMDYSETAREHSRLLLPMIDRLFAAMQLCPTNLDALAFGRGPGSFTGARIAAGVAQGIALAADCPVLPISNLAAIAQRCYRERQASHVLCGIDARMQEVYWGAYHIDGKKLMQPLIDERVCAPKDIILPNQQQSTTWLGAGTAWVTYQKVLRDACSTLPLNDSVNCLSHAQDIVTLAVDAYQRGNGVCADLAQPVYLRDKVAKTLSERAQS